MTFDDLFSNNGSKMLTYTMQPLHHCSMPYDKDFDPHSFGGRPPVSFSKVHGCDPSWSSVSDGDPTDPEIITTFDFL